MNSSLACKTSSCIAVSFVLLLSAGCGPTNQRDADTHRVQRDDFALWSVFDGTIQAERVAPVYSQISQPSAILFLAPEGNIVAAGDVVAELDRSSLDQSLATLERDYSLATTELDTLMRATIPAEQAAAANELDKLRFDERKQQRIVANTEMLQTNGLVSESELEGQRILLGNLQKQVVFQETRLNNLKEIIHPAAETKLRAQAEAAKRQLDAVKEQFDSARITAPFSGMVVYVPQHLDGEFRNAREGDTIFRNQKIMQVADMASLVVECQIPESSVSLVQPGHIAVVTPGAFPQIKLRGVVETVGSVAVSVSGRPSWQKFFNVLIRLHDRDERLRSSMSATVQVLSREEENALTIPRSFVGWTRGEPWCLKEIDGEVKMHPVVLDAGNDLRFLVRDGLAEGDIIHRPVPNP